MKKIIALISCGALLLGTFAGCGTNDLATAPTESIVEESITEEPATESSEKPAESTEGLYTDETFPEGTAEEQEIIDRYINPYAISGLFTLNFSPDDMSEIDGGKLQVLFHMLQRANGEGFPTVQAEDGTVLGVGKDVFEEFLTRHFNLTTEEIRVKCADFYNEESETYDLVDGIGGGPSQVIITEHSREGDVLTFSYDWYGPAETKEGDEFYYEIVRQGTMVVQEPNGEPMVFVSNSSQDA